jgi:hypothetical protein
VKYRLLLALDVLDFTAALTRREQEVLWKRFREIRDYPHQYSDYREPDSEGRLLDVHVHSGFAIHFWEDGADRHIKILQICRADR